MGDYDEYSEPEFDHEPEQDADYDVVLDGPRPCQLPTRRSRGGLYGMLDEARLWQKLYRSEAREHSLSGRRYVLTERKQDALRRAAEMTRHVHQLAQEVRSQLTPPITRPQPRSRRPRCTVRRRSRSSSRDGPDEPEPEPERLGRSALNHRHNPALPPFWRARLLAFLPTRVRARAWRELASRGLSK
jgi:hypothetical protein